MLLEEHEIRFVGKCMLVIAFEGVARIQVFRSSVHYVIPHSFDSVLKISCISAKGVKLEVTREHCTNKGIWHPTGEEAPLPFEA
jgi:hypothetical protein